MLRSTFPRPSRFRPALITMCVIGLVVIVALLAVQLRGEVERTAVPAPSVSPTAKSNGPTPAGSLAAGPGDRARLEPVTGSADPVVFADSVARAMFEWDTTTGRTVGDYTGRLLAVADPTGHESPGLAADLATYLPATEAWEQLTRYGTRQWLDVTTVVVPDQWALSLAQAPPGSVVPGTTAVTVTGVRHRAGTWEGQHATAEFDVAFSVFVVCGPTYPTCHLLRLSQLDHPLR